MSKEQFNYLLVLATLFIVWLYFNTFYVNAKNNYGRSRFAGMPAAASAIQFPNPSAISAVPRLPKAPNMSSEVPMQEETPKLQK
jgi:hypothetical protein